MIFSTIEQPYYYAWAYLMNECKGRVEDLSWHPLFSLVSFIESNKLLRSSQYIMRLVKHFDTVEVCVFALESFFPPIPLPHSFTISAPFSFLVSGRLLLRFLCFYYTIYYVNFILSI